MTEQEIEEHEPLTKRWRVDDVWDRQASAIISRLKTGVSWTRVYE